MCANNSDHNSSIFRGCVKSRYHSVELKKRKKTHTHTVYNITRKLFSYRLKAKRFSFVWNAQGSLNIIQLTKYTHTIPFHSELILDSVLKRFALFDCAKWFLFSTLCECECGRIFFKTALAQYIRLSFSIYS